VPRHLDDPTSARFNVGASALVNRFLHAGRLICLVLLLLVCCSVAALAQVNVYMRGYNTSRTQANLQETILTPQNVSPNNFGKLFTVHTDGEIYTQPLYVSNLGIAGGTHNVIFVGTTFNSIYAIDADNGTIYWQQNFGYPIIAQDVQNDWNISWYTGIGIIGTPVIDPDTNILYVVNGHQPQSGQQSFTYYLNAIDITNGNPVNGSPKQISASYSTPDLNTPEMFQAKTQNQRCGLTLANGNIYMCFGSHQDIMPYTGWMMAYNKSTLNQVAVYAVTTIGSEGGIWMAGQAPVVDGSGNLYVSTGNGSSGTTPNGLYQAGESIIKLSPSLQLLDYFTPFNAASLSAGDMDLASAGVIMVPNTNYVLGGGKQGVLYLLNTSNLGHFNASHDNVQQEFQAIFGQGTSHIHGTASYFDSDAKGPTLYVWGENDVLRSFLYNSTTGTIDTTPWATSTMTAPVTNNDGAMPGGFTSISANGNSNGILWASTPYNGNAAGNSNPEFAGDGMVEGVLYAFNADTLQLLWSDKDNDSHDDIGLFAKYLPPMVANGKMYVPNFGTPGTTDGSGNLVVYGLFNPPTTKPTLTVTANNATRVYGAANPTFSGTVTGQQNGDTFTEGFTTAATTTSGVGSYPIVPSVTGNNLGNYTVDIVNGTLTVTGALTTTTLTAPATSTYGTSVTLTATVTSADGTPGGSVTFLSGTTVLGTGTLNGSGVATLSTTAIPGGTDSLTAGYGAAGNFNASTSSASSITVSQATQTITFAPIASRPYGSAPFAATATSSAGSKYPVTITVQSGPAVISGGMVSLTGAGTVALQATQAGDANYSAAAAVVQSFQVTPAPLTVSANNATRGFGAANPTFNGTVTGAVGSDSFTESFTTTATTTSAVGSYPIVPAATGANLASYTVTIVNGTLTVSGASTTTTLTAPGTEAYGASVTLTATVASTSGTPGGIVTFYSGSTAVGTGTLNASGVTTLTTTTLPVGTDSLTASYAATGNFGASTSAASSITVTAASQTITFAPIGSRAYGSAPFAVTATSSLGSSYPVTITVQSGPATINGGIVTITGAGTVVLQAAQAGNTDYGAATTTQSFQVTPAPLTVAASNATRTFGTANPAFSGTITGAVGSDSFSESFTTTATATSNVGSYPIVPTVTGSQLANYTVTIVNGTLTVAGVATTTTLTAPGSSNYGATVTLTAAVTSTSVTPGGTVTFLSGSTPIGMGALNGGVATLSTTALPAGSDAVTASYAASGNFAASASPATILTVKGASQTITFPAIASRAYGSAPFAVTATSSLGSSYPVTISVVSGPATISGGTVTITGVGTVALQATQAGGGNYDPATATQSFPVTPAATTTNLSAPASAAVGVSVTLTATVASAAGLPTGTVTFYNGSTSLGVGTLSSSGIATLSTTALPAGTDTAIATYAAAGNFAGSSSSAATLTISAAPVKPLGAYTVAASPTTFTIPLGGAGKTTLTFTPTGGYTGTVSLSCLNLPANASCAFATNQVSLSGDNQSVNTALTINTTMQTSKNVPSDAPQNPFTPALFALVFWCPGGLTGLAVLARKRKLVKTQRFWHLCLLLAGAWVFAVGLSGCGMHGFVANVTPGTSQVTVVATGTSGSVVTTQTVTLTINMTSVTQ
jgi:Bacterial Ig-like domain (group 3)/MBG domain (YGX type)